MRRRKTKLGDVNEQTSVLAVDESAEEAVELGATLRVSGGTKAPDHGKDKYGFKPLLGHAIANFLVLLRGINNGKKKKHNKKNERSDKLTHPFLICQEFVHHGNHQVNLRSNHLHLTSGNRLS